MGGVVMNRQISGMDHIGQGSMSETARHALRDRAYDKNCYVPALLTIPGPIPMSVMILGAYQPIKLTAVWISPSGTSWPPAATLSWGGCTAPTLTPTRRCRLAQHGDSQPTLTFIPVR